MSTPLPPGPPPHALPPISSAYRCPPSNYHTGREGQAIRFFIRHATESQGPGNAPSLPWFLSTASGVSIHHLITRNGQRLDLVERVNTAYHCGISAWGDTSGSSNGIALMNLCSLGMEFESSSTAAAAGSGYTTEQLWAGAYTEACTTVSYSGVTVLDHKQIALPAGRRQDPARFPYDLYLPMVQAWVAYLRSLSADLLPHWCL